LTEDAGSLVLVVIAFVLPFVALLIVIALAAGFFSLRRRLRPR
jgi:hypothetical protein